MTDPLDTNDEWAELARELDRDKPPVPAAPPADRVERIIEEEAVEPHHGDARVEDAALAEGETEAEAAEDEFDDAEETPAGEAVAEGEQPGTGRKRRRRRRRRRKGAPAEGAAAPADGPDADGPAEAETEEEEPAAESAEADDFGAEDVDGEAVPLAADEDTASEVLRELIATWNVPSWDEIVSGLYRPN